MNTTTRIIVPLLCGGLVATAFADVVDPYAGYIRLTGNDSVSSLSTTSWNRKGNWDIEGEDFLTDANYYVPADKTLVAWGRATTPAGKWAGGQLVVAGTLLTYVNSNKDNAPKFDDLVFLGGSTLNDRSSYGSINWPSRITVLAPNDNPLLVKSSLTSGSSSYSIKFNALFCGDPDSGIRFEIPDNAKVKSLLYLTETFSNYYGTVTIAGTNTRLVASDANNRLVLPGKLVVEDSVVFTPPADRVAFLGGLDAEGEVALAKSGAKTDATLSITNSLRVADGGRLTVSGFAEADLYNRAIDAAAKGRRIALQIGTLSGAAAQDEQDVADAKVWMGGDEYTEAFDWKIFTEDAGDGTKNLFAGATNIATCVKDGTGGASKTDTTLWAGGVLPTEGCDFYFRNRANVFTDWDYTRSRIIFGTKTAGGYGSHYWSGNALVFDAKAYYAIASMSWAIYGANNAKGRCITGGPFTISSGFTVNMNMNCDDYYPFRIESELRGNGAIAFKPINDRVSAFRAELTNLNTNFHGRVSFFGYAGAGKYNTVLGDARNWGGEFLADANTYSAVTLGTNTCVYVTNNVCFNEPTRGIFLKNGTPRFKVKEGFTLTLSNQVTFATTLTKEDAGVLELGGTARFMDGQVETAPVEGRNGLLVAEGALKVLSKEACDGLAISFAEGTKLLIPAQSADGLYDVKWDAPLASSATDGKLAVAIDTAGATLPEQGFTTTLATLNATAAEGVPADFFKVEKVPGYTCIGVTKRTTDAGVAYDATFEKHGVLLILR